MRGARSESSRCERYNLRVEPTAYGGGSRANPLGGHEKDRGYVVFALSGEGCFGW